MVEEIRNIETARHQRSKGVLTSILLIFNEFSITFYQDES